MDDCLIIGSQRKLRHTDSCLCGHAIAWLNPEALITRDKEGETPLDNARRSGACAEIIACSPSARSLGGKGIRQLYKPVGYWRDGMFVWIQSRSWGKLSQDYQ